MPVVESKRFLPDHPIVFVMDFSNDDAEVPQYDRERLALGSDSCVSVRTIADVDGELTVSLSDDAPPAHAGLGHCVFAGDIHAPSCWVAVVTSANEKLLERFVGRTTASIQIYVNDEACPERIWVVAK